MMPYPYPVVPETITVHLGAPGESARNVVVPFAQYIKNVASHEIYPTWPESAIRANILAQISYALNRVYTEYYRARGYDFDITSTTRYDQAYVEDGDIFENISRIVDDIFNNYIVRQGSVEPLFAQFCDGVRTRCGGLSQWGSVDLAEEGMTPYEKENNDGERKQPMKKVISLMLALVLALSLTACGGKAGPEGVVGQFCKGLQELDEKAIAQCFENGDDLELSDLEDVDSDDAVAQKIMDFMKSCAGQLKYQVGEATVDGDTATVPVEFTYVNAGSLMTEILTEYISQAWSLALSGADDEKLAAAFEEVFDEKTTGADFPTLTATLTIPCVQTSDGWKISSSADNSEELSAQLLDILTSNIYGALEDFGAGLLG